MGDYWIMHVCSGKALFLHCVVFFECRLVAVATMVCSTCGAAHCNVLPFVMCSRLVMCVVT